MAALLLMLALGLAPAAPPADVQAALEAALATPGARLEVLEVGPATPRGCAARSVEAPQPIAASGRVALRFAGDGAGGAPCEAGEAGADGRPGPDGAGKSGGAGGAFGTSAWGSASGAPGGAGIAGKHPRAVCDQAAPAQAGEPEPEVAEGHERDLVLVERDAVVELLKRICVTVDLDVEAGEARMDLDHHG
jgi:hypothetical protein